MKRQKYAKIFLLCFLISLSTITAAWAVVEAPSEVYVGDYANVLNEATEQLIIAENERLEAASGAQIVVVTVDFLDGMEIEDYAYTIFNDWGIGDAEKNNGLLLLLVIGEENYWAMQGDGIYRALTSGTLDEYLYSYLEPDFAVGDYDAGTAKVFQAFVEWYDNYYQLSKEESSASGVISGTTVNEESEDIDWGGVLIMLALVVIIVISLKRRNKDREDRKNNKHNNTNRPNSTNYPDYPDMSGGGTMSSGRTFRPNVYPRTNTLKPRNTAKPTSTPRPSSKPPSFGGGSSRGGGAGRNSAAGLGRSIGKSLGSGAGRSFGGGRSRGGGAGRR